VNDDGTSENALLANQFDETISGASLGVSLTISLEVAQVTDMAFTVCWGTVGLAVWVVVRASAEASVGVVSKLMDMESTLGIGVVAGDIPADGGRRGLGGLLEGHLSCDLGVSSNDGNCFNHFDRLIEG